MKSYFTTFILTVLFLVSTFSSSFAQTHWTKDTPNNPVLDPGPSGAWDDLSVGIPSVLFDGSTYHMWYSGYDGTNGRIGYATSPDGITWTKYDDPTTTDPPFAESDPVLKLGSPGSWEGIWVHKPYVIFDGSTYHMWYSGYDGTNSRIGYATSSDRITWTKYAGNPVMDKGPTGSWDVNGVESPCILFDGSIYHMWYNGWDGPQSFHIGYATSPDGITWTKYAGNPVLDMGPVGSWDYSRVEAPDVFFDGNKYHMWYSGGPTLWSWRIGYATSPDRITWTKYAGNPVMDKGPPGSWDDLYVGFSRVLLDTTNSQYKMWYTGGNAVWDGHIGYATAPAPVGINDNISTNIADDYVLSPNYPNPFNPITTIEFDLPKSSEVSLKVFNILGEEVTTLVADKLSTGSYSYEWDASSLASGVYLYRLQAGDYVETRKMLLMR